MSEVKALDIIEAVLAQYSDGDPAILAATILDALTERGYGIADLRAGTVYITGDVPDGVHD